MRTAALIVAILVLWIEAIPACAGSRVALVIGNGAYRNVPLLPNPVNDAADLSASLKRLNFDVQMVVNAGYDEMRRALIDFSQKAGGVEIALIFFAGHGIQIDGENWLIPVDAQLASEVNVGNETIGLQSLIRAVSNTTKLGLVVLDACRNDPFRARMKTSNLSRAVDRGFSRVEPSDNVLVAYAARDGTTASDGTGRNSPFTTSLLKNIETPGLEVRFLFANVRDDVMAATGRKQQPFVYGSLSKDLVYFRPPTEATHRPVESAPAPAPSPPAATSKAPTTPPPTVAAKTTATALIGEESRLASKPVLISKGSATWDAAFETILASVRSLSALLDNQGIKPAGNLMIVYTSTDDKGFTFQAEIPIDQFPKNLGKDMSIGKSPEGRALKFVHRGSYDNMDVTYEAITNHLDEKKLVAGDKFVEEYLTDPLKTAEDKQVINVWVPLK